MFDYQRGSIKYHKIGMIPSEKMVKYDKIGIIPSRWKVIDFYGPFSNTPFLMKPYRVSIDISTINPSYWSYTPMFITLLICVPYYNSV